MAVCRALEVDVAGYPDGVMYRGINRAGGEYLDEWDGWTGQLYYEIPTAAPLASELAAYASRGFNCIRFPISWERLQHELGGPLDPGYSDQVAAFVQQATAGGWLVVVDLHTYNRYASGAFDAAGVQVPPGGGYVQHVYGEGVLGRAELIDVWKRLATLLAGNPDVAFGLMNEPHDFPVTSTDWFADLQAVIDAIRGTGAGQLILVPNSRGSDVAHWDTYSPNGGPLDSVAALAITDSADNYAFDMHAYQEPGAPTSYAALVTPVTEWAEKHGRRLFLSELGVRTDDPDGAAAITDLLTYLDDHAGVWLGWTPWNLSPNELTVRGEDGAVKDGPQLPWYAPFLTPGMLHGASPDGLGRVLTGVGAILGGVAQDGGGWLFVGGVLRKVPPRSPLLALLSSVVARGPVELTDAAVLRDLAARLTR